MFDRHHTFGVRKKMFGSRIRRLKALEDRKKKAATVRWSKSGEDRKTEAASVKKKYDLEKSYLADEMSSDDDSIVSLTEKTKSKARCSSQQETNYLAADEMNSNDDSMVLRTRSKTKLKIPEIPVKRRIFSRDPRLGFAARALKEFEKPPDTDPVSNLDEDEVVNEPSSDWSSDESLYDSAGYRVDRRLQKARLKKYFEKVLPKTGRTQAWTDQQAWNQQYREQLKIEQSKEKEILGETDYTLASLAVKFYNHKHSTNYVLVETLGSYNAEFDDGFWTHCNFRAQNTGGPARRLPVSRLFFAELFGYWGEYEVDSCVTLDGPGRCREIVRGCEICPKWVCHPANEFKNGHPDPDSDPDEFTTF